MAFIEKKTVTDLDRSEIEKIHRDGFYHVAAAVDVEPDKFVNAASGVFFEQENENGKNINPNQIHSILVTFLCFQLPVVVVQ